MVIGDMPDRVQDVVGKLQCITGGGGVNLRDITVTFLHDAICIFI